MAKSYEIFYETNGGKLYCGTGEIKSSKFLPGELIVIPSVPVKEFELFDGWFLDESCTQPMDFSYMPRQDFVIYAKWKPAFRNIYLEANGGKVTDFEDQSKEPMEYLAISVPVGDKIVLPRAVNEGDRFAGWFCDKELTKPFDWIYMPDENLTAYAKWEVIKRAERGKITVKRKIITTTVEKVITHNKIDRETPEFKFKLSRQDVLDFVESINFENLSSKATGDKKPKNEYKYPISTEILERKNEKGYDILRCGVWTFAVLKEKKEVLKFIARMSEQMAESMREAGHDVNQSNIINNGQWYDVIIDTSYDSKREVYSYIEDWYYYAIQEYYKYNVNDDIYETDSNKAIDDDNYIYECLNGKKTIKDELYDAKIKEYAAAVKAFKSKVKLEFSMSKQKITDHVKSTQSKECKIIEREFTKTGLILPNSYNWKDRTYMMVYEKKGVVKCVCRIADEYAENLATTHVEVCRSKFPKGRNWYDVVIDGTFSAEDEVWEIIDASREFVILTAAQHSEEIKEAEIIKTLK